MVEKFIKYEQYMFFIIEQIEASIWAQAHLDLFYVALLCHNPSAFYSSEAAFSTASFITFLH